MRGLKNFKGSDARCPSIHFLFCGKVIDIEGGWRGPDAQTKFGDNFDQVLKLVKFS